jgi:REP element-mobilizing transposase RayT
MNSSKESPKSQPMGMQVSRCVHIEVSQEEPIRMGTRRARSDHAMIGPTERSAGGGSDRAKNFVAQNSWARGYYVSTVGRDEEQIRNYITEQEKKDKRLD